MKATGKVAGIKEIAVVGPTGKEARPLTAQQSPFLILNLRSFLLRFLSTGAARCGYIPVRRARDTVLEKGPKESETCHVSIEAK